MKKSKDCFRKQIELQRKIPADVRASMFQTWVSPDCTAARFSSQSKLKTENVLWGWTCQ